MGGLKWVLDLMKQPLLTTHDTSAKFVWVTWHPPLNPSPSNGAKTGLTGGFMHIRETAFDLLNGQSNNPFISDRPMNQQLFETPL